MSKEKEKVEIVGMYKGDNLNPEDVAKDMAEFHAEKTHNELIEQGFRYIGSFNKDTPKEVVDKMMADAIEEGARRFYGD